VSPLRRIRVARGISIAELCYRACITDKTLSKIDKMDADTIGGLKIESLMRVAMVLECSPVDLVPFLGTRIKGKGKLLPRKPVKRGQFRVGEDRSMKPGSFGTRDRT
jgi:DNA-binding Xre family transcriptional regulator